MIDLLSNASERVPSVQRLTAADFQSPTWRKLVAIWKHRRQGLREQNDHPQSEDATARLRGRIEEITFNLAQPEYFSRADQATIEPGDISAMY